jgi:hypothetical protein
MINKIIKRIITWIYQNKTRLLSVLFILLLKEIFLRIPYVNIVFITKGLLINTFVGLALFLVLFGFNSRKLIISSLILFCPLAGLTLLRYNTAEVLGNIVFILLFFGISLEMISFVKDGNK